MYAVIRTGGKQYRVQAGDLLVVERLPGEPGAVLAFDDVLMLGQGAEVTVGAPTVVGAKVEATLIETRKGEKIKVFKKIRRQGYRRTRGHRQFESVLRVTGIGAEGVAETWDGTVDLTPLATLNARARNLARGMEAAEAAKLDKTKAPSPDDEAEPGAAEIQPTQSKMVKPRKAAASAAKPKAAGAKTARPKTTESKSTGKPASKSPTKRKPAARKA